SSVGGAQREGSSLGSSEASASSVSAASSRSVGGSGTGSVTASGAASPRGSAPASPCGSAAGPLGRAVSRACGASGAFGFVPSDASFLPCPQRPWPDGPRQTVQNPRFSGAHQASCSTQLILS